MKQPLDVATCSNDLRERILTAYPSARTVAFHLRAILFMAFNAERDRASRRPLCAERHIMWIWGGTLPHGRGAEKKPTTGEAVLKKIRSELLPDLTWTKPIWKEGRARTITCTGLMPDVLRSVDADLERPVSDLHDRVYVVSGLRYRKDARTVAREDALEQARDLAATAPSHVTSYIISRLNSDADHPLKGFTAVEKYARGAIRRAKSYSPGSRLFNPCDEFRKEKRQGPPLSPAQRLTMYRRILLQTIRAIQDLPQPFYRPSTNGNTDRVFGLGPSLLDLPSAVRREFTDPAGWVDVDLSSAHLGIASSLWNVPGIAARLRSGTSIWKELMDGLEHKLQNATGTRDDLKAVLKEATYSAVYGMEVADLKRKISCEMRASGFAAVTSRDVVCLPVFAELLGAREAEYQRIKAAGIRAAPSGIKIDPTRLPRKQMATLAQSYEAVLMCAILEYEQRELARAESSNEQPDFRIMLWQHDGCSIRFHSRKATHLRGMQQAVDAAAAHFGIPTRLEVKE